MRRLGFAVAAALCAGVVVAPSSTGLADGSVPSGTWEGWVSIGYTVKFDADGTFVFVNGGGPMLFESVAGALDGDLQLSAEIFIRPDKTNPFGPQTGGLTLSSKIAGGSGSVTLRDITGVVDAVAVQVPFAESTGTMTIDRIGCVLVGGELVYSPAGVAAIDAVATFQNITARWSAALVADVMVEEERRIVESLAVRMDEVARALRTVGGVVDRRVISELLAESERRVAGLSAEAQCGADWTTPLAESTLNLLAAALEQVDAVSALDLQFIIETAIRAGGLPSPDGSFETSIAAALNTKLEAAIAANDRVAADAVFMSAVAIGDRDLATRAAAAGGGR